MDTLSLKKELSLCLQFFFLFSLFKNSVVLFCFWDAIYLVGSVSWILNGDGGDALMNESLLSNII